MENGPFEFRLQTDEKSHIKPGIEDLVELWELRWSEKGVPMYGDLYEEVLRENQPPLPGGVGPASVAVVGGAIVAYWIKLVLGERTGE